VSVPANIAEGNGRWYRKEYLHHLSVARGSLKEAETILKIGRMLGYTEQTNVNRALGLSEEVSKMLTAMRKGLS
jgi:four helix bundle protein